MTDLEITKLCAEAIGWKYLGAVGTNERNDENRPWCLNGQNDWWRDPEGHYVCEPCAGSVPDPLHNDTHAMALVKRFRPRLLPNLETDAWMAWLCDDTHTVGPDVNSAIVRCIAEMQVKKATV